MALRKILTQGDEQLLKRSRKVEKFDARLHTLIDDMRETLENSGGVGLAAPQVGILRRVVVLLDINKDPEEMVELVNPEVIEQRGGNAYRKQQADTLPMRRMAVPQDCVGPAVFLASHASDFVTGNILIVDGGSHAK